MKILWQTYGEFSGWQWEGVVPARVLVGETWEQKALRVVTAAEGGMVDMVQCYDAGIMTAGPLGATARFGTLQALLGFMPRERLQGHLGALFEEAGVGLHTSHAPGGVQATFTKGLRPITEERELRELFMAGSDGKAWNGEQVDYAEQWVRGLAALLADSAAVGAISTASVATLRTYLAPARSALGWTPVFPGANELLPPTDPAVRRFAAAWIAFAVNHPRGARRMLDALGGRAHPHLPAEALLREAQKGPAGGYPATFPQRVNRTLRALDAEHW